MMCTRRPQIHVPVLVLPSPSGRQSTRMGTHLKEIILSAGRTVKALGLISGGECSDLGLLQLFDINCPKLLILLLVTVSSDWSASASLLVNDTMSLWREGIIKKVRMVAQNVWEASVQV